MKYYKVLKDNKVIDVLDKLIYIKWQTKHNIPILCDIDEAQAILSSDKNTIWHEETLYALPISGFDTVRIEEIDAYEYKQLCMLNLNTPQEIMDAFLLELIAEGVV